MEPTSGFNVGGSLPIEPSVPQAKSEGVHQPIPMLPAITSPPVQISETLAKSIESLAPQKDTNAAILSRFTPPFGAGLPFVNDQSISKAVGAIADSILHKQRG